MPVEELESNMDWLRRVASGLVRDSDEADDAQVRARHRARQIVRLQRLLGRSAVPSTA